MHWNVGKVRITKIVELETVDNTRFILPLATNEEIQKLPWLIPHFANDEGRLNMAVDSLLVETPTRRIIVDTGLGNDKQGRKVPTWNNRQDPFLDNLTKAGFAPDSIDTVLLRTCMSITSAGIPSGRRQMGADLREGALVFGKTEYDYWRDHSDERPTNGGVRGFRQTDRRRRPGRPGRQRPQLTDEITLIPTPGHSPGHMSIHITVGRRRGPAHRRRRPPPLPDGPARLVVDRGFRRPSSRR